MPPKSQKSNQPDLIPADTSPRWSVETRDGVHHLFYGIKTQQKSSPPSSLEKFRTIAKFCNDRGLKPRPAVQCLADESGSLDAAMRKQTKRAERLPRPFP